MARTRFAARQRSDEKETIKANAAGATSVAFARNGVVSVLFPSQAAGEAFQGFLHRMYPDHTKGELYRRKRVVGYGFFFHTHASP